MHSMAACKLSSLNYQIKKQLFHVVTGIDTLEEKQLDTKVPMEFMGMMNTDGDRVLDSAVANDFVIGNILLIHNTLVM